MRFRDHEVVGDILELARRYRDEGADELVFYDITASPDGRSVDRSWVRRVARFSTFPSASPAASAPWPTPRKCSAKAPRRSRSTRRRSPIPELIDRLSARFGAQCVVVGIDSQTVDGDYYVYQFTGDPEPHAQHRPRTLDWVREVQERGAGEIVLNCMASDGVRQGYDIAQLTAVRRICNVPLIASGGAGAPEHFAEVFDEARVDGALAASVFHTGAIAIPDLKRYLRGAGDRGAAMSSNRSSDARLGQGRRPAARDRAGRAQRPGADARLHEPRALCAHARGASA